MQGFPVGGSRIRLSWGRSQCTFSPSFTIRLSTFLTDKAAQAAAQAAQAAALQAQYVQPPVAPQAPTQFSALNGLSQEEAIQLLSKFTVGQQQKTLDPNIAVPNYNAGGPYLNGHGLGTSPTASLYSEDKIRAALLSSREDAENPHPSYAPRHAPSSFQPFSPDPNVYDGKFARRDSVTTTALTEVLPHSTKTYTPGFYAEKDEKTVGVRLSPTSRGPTRFSNFLSAPASTPSPSNTSASSPPPALQVNRAPAPISRPPSGQPILVKERPGDEMRDLNGTLASLNLVDPRDLAQSQTRTGNGGGLKSPSESTDSTASVQFRLSASP